MNPVARFQVVEVKHGYAVKDTRDGSIWTKTYQTARWASLAAVRLNEAHRDRRYSGAMSLPNGDRHGAR